MSPPRRRRTLLDQFLEALAAHEEREIERFAALAQKVDHYTQIALAERRASLDNAAKLADHEKRIKALEEAA